MKGKYLITTDNWFLAPDGNEYRAIYGNVEILSDEILGVKTNRMSSNWFAKLSGDKEEMIIAGCQIYYAIKTDKKPKNKHTKHWNSSVDKGVKIMKIPSKIYILK